MKKVYSSPKVGSLGQHADLVAAGGASRDVDGTFYRDDEKFASFGTDPFPDPS